MWAEDTDWLSVFRWFRIYSQHCIEFRMPSALNLYTDLLSSLVKLGGLLLPSLLLLWQALFIVCSNFWPLNKSITRLVQLRVKLIGKDSDAGRFWGQEENGTTEDEMAGWCHWLNAHEFGWTLGVDDGHEGLGVLQFMGSQRIGHDWATELTN